MMMIIIITIIIIIIYFPSMCAVPNVSVFCSSFLSC
jgi:hypothetical protein